MRTEAQRDAHGGFNESLSRAHFALPHMLTPRRAEAVCPKAQQGANA
jgi:hypothetical protein